MEKKLPANNWAARKYQDPVWRALTHPIGQGGFRRVCVNAHRRYGKDSLCSHALAFRAYHEGGLHILSAPSNTQALKIYTQSFNSQGFTLLDEAFPDWMRDHSAGGTRGFNRQDQILHLKSANGKGARILIAGCDFHEGWLGMNPKTVSFSEASRAADENCWYSTIEPILEENQGHAWFISTPFGQSSWFYQICRLAEKHPDWYFLKQTIQDTYGNGQTSLNPKDIEEKMRLQPHKAPEMRREYFCDELEGTENNLFDAEAVDICMNRDPAPEIGQPLRVVAVDCARFGGDSAVICGRVGHNMRVEKPVVLEKCSIPQLAEAAYQYAMRLKAQVLVVDSTGLGGGVSDLLKQYRKFRVKECNFARLPGDPRYGCTRTMIYHNLKDAMEHHACCLPQISELREELLATKYDFTADDKIKVESKDLMRRALGRSPDHLDAYAMLWFVVDPAPQDRYNAGGGNWGNGGPHISHGHASW